MILNSSRKEINGRRESNDKTLFKAKEEK